MAICRFVKNTMILFLQIMIETNKKPIVAEQCLAPNRLSDLQTIVAGFDRCQKSLNDYLDSKRNAFPRFFFISDDELLSLLGGSDPENVQEHIVKVILIFSSFFYLVFYTSIWCALDYSIE